MQKQKGFTLIELIVVIAIIAILAAIVMVNVVQYIGRAKDATVISDLNSLQTNSIAWVADPAHNGSYTGFSADTTVGCAGPIKTAIESAEPGQYNILQCEEADQSGNNADATQWVGCFNLINKDSATGYNSYCVDSTGFKGFVSYCAAYAGGYHCPHP